MVRQKPRPGDWLIWRGSQTSCREIYGITSNEQKRFKIDFSICLIVFKACWESISIQALRKTIEQRVFHFSYPEMHLVSYISESFGRMDSGDNFTTDLFALLYFCNEKEAYRSSNKVNYIRQMFKHNDRFTSLDYMVQTLSYLALQGWYNIDSAKVFHLLSATDKRRSKLRAHLLRLQTIEH